jgi:hypothetical protein
MAIEQRILLQPLLHSMLKDADDGENGGTQAEMRLDPTEPSFPNQD